MTSGLVLGGLLSRREGLRDSRLTAVIGDGLRAVRRDDVRIVELALSAGRVNGGGSFLLGGTFEIGVAGGLGAHMGTYLSSSDGGWVTG